MGLFFLFFRIGLFTLGGGYAMVPLMEREAVKKRGWLRPEEFVDMIAVAQSMPGMLAVNIAVYVGNRRKGFGGALAAGAGVVAPALIVMLLVVAFFRGYQDHPHVIRVFRGLRPAVAALVTAAVWDLGRKARLRGWGFALAAAAALWAWKAPVSPVWLVGLAAAAGACFWGRAGAANAVAAAPAPPTPDPAPVERPAIPEDAPKT